jgi:hypothetical protein
MRLIFTFLLLSFYTISTAQIPSYVPTNGLVGWWPFNGNANDESGNGNNGTVNGATLTSDRNGNINSAYSFNGTNQWINMPSGSITTMNITTDMTLSFWFKTNQTGAGLIGFGDNVNGFNGGYLAAIGNSTLPNVSGKMSFFSANNWYRGNRTLVDNMWHHTCITISGTILKIIIDNNIDTLVANVGHPISFNGLRAIGARNDGLPGFFNGIIDDIAIYNRALTQQEITQLYTRTIATSTPDDTSSNVGIGTTNPKRKLHVNDVMRLEPRDTAPSNPAKGDIYFDGVLNKLRVYDGSVWQNCW